MKIMQTSSTAVNTYPRFKFPSDFSEEHLQSSNKNGFLHFTEFIDKEMVQKVINAAKETEEAWLKKDVKQVYGVPIKYGKDLDGKKIVQRFAFLSLHNDVIKKFLEDERFQKLFALLGGKGRIGEFENDGVVFNHYVYANESQFTQMGWHTDSMRDVFYGEKINRMLNVGLHLDNFTEGGCMLCVLPGTHKQGLGAILFRKKYFVDNRPDKNEMQVKTNAGDLTIHDGAIWHRVAQSTIIGEASRRRVMYIPFLTGKFKPKSEKSRPRVYQRFMSMVK